MPRLVLKQPIQIRWPASTSEVYMRRYLRIFGDKPDDHIRTLPQVQIVPSNAARSQPLIISPCRIIEAESIAITVNPIVIINGP